MIATSMQAISIPVCMAIAIAIITMYTAILMVAHADNKYLCQ